MIKEGICKECSQEMTPIYTIEDNKSVLVGYACEVCEQPDDDRI